MNWIKPIIKGLAMAAVPVKLLDKGIDHAKHEFREEIGHYGVKLKMMVLLGSAFMIMLIFLSVTLALVLGQWIGSLAGGFAIIAGTFLMVFFSLLMAYKDQLQEK
ncbi:phage holin family protein [Fulvivirga sp.]|jgi:ABC-type dipeptide/oligopeptide/nickel transport system permease subunit|uniref:phage holin family protein n=1 Tax=Fulvivirga sp. TaxID=1931237 RepID=UPI0032ED4F85